MIIDNVIFEKGNPGRKDGIRVVPEGCEFKERTPVHLNGQFIHLVGFVNLRLENGVIVGRLQIIFPERVPKKVYPALGFVINSRADKDVTKCRIVNALLCDHENEDETIPAIELP